MSATSEIDWEAADQVAAHLGINTRRLVATGDADQASAWALQMSREHSGVAALSYYELAVMLGHRDPKVTAGASLDWNKLLQEVGKLAAAVKVKVDEENAAARKAEAERVAAAAKRLVVVEEPPEP